MYICICSWRMTCPSPASPLSAVSLAGRHPRTLAFDGSSKIGRDAGVPVGSYVDIK